MQRGGCFRGGPDRQTLEIGGLEPIYPQNISIIKNILVDLLPISLIQDQVIRTQLNSQYGGFEKNLPQLSLSRQQLQPIKEDQSKKVKANRRKIQMTNFSRTYVYKWVKQVLHNQFPQLLQDKRVMWKTIKTDRDTLKFFLSLRKLFDDTQWTMIHQLIEEKSTGEINFSHTFKDCRSKLQKCLGNIGNFHWKQAIQSIYSKPAKQESIIKKHFKNEMIDPRNLDRK